MVIAVTLAVTLALSLAGLWLTLRDAEQNAPSPDGGEGERGCLAAGLTRELKVYSAVSTAVCLGVALTLALAYPRNTFIFNMRRLCLLSLLAPAAFTDYKSYRIPNAFIIAGIAYWALLFAAETVVTGVGGMLGIAGANLLTAGAVSAAAFLCGLAIRGSIGAGDVKLFMVMGLLLSVEGIWGAVLLSLAVSFVASAWLLLTKRKTRKDTLPFAPALAAGTLMSVLLTGM
ncbi:MAG: A24 family peptidase [Oscillospiraceae bacterium]|jgi:leader peptidase (prepilin peptidase)/N-methyltransferase|nr:A24 family peptidase [Oscillospiraceae bacterium]